MDLSETQLLRIRDNLHRLSPSEKTDVLRILDELETRKTVKKARTSLLDFVKSIEPDYKIGAHHKKLAALLEDLAFGRKDRIAVNIAPRFGKSHLVSYYFPAWYLGSFPDKKVMMVSHTADLAVDFGRKVRNLIDSEKYRAIFEDVSLSQDSKSAGRWHTNHGGEYFAVGVGGAIAGRGADLLLVDDPHNEQDIINGNLDVFDKAYEWFTTGARTRLMPGGRVAIVQCLVGDTRVLTAGAGEKLLRDVRPGDMVASYDSGCLVASKVLNWANQGLDRVYTIALRSGNVVTGNERHPFLANTSGGPEWVRLRDLKPGMSLVSVPTSASQRGVINPQKQPHVRDCVRLAEPERGITKNTPKRHTDRWGTTVCGRVKTALLRVVATLQKFRGAVLPVTTSWQTNVARNRVFPTTLINAVSSIFGRGMGLPPLNMRGCLNSSTGVAPFVVQSQQIETPPRIGSTTDSQLTTAMLPGAFAGSCVTPATSSSKTGIASTYLSGPSNTSGFVLDEVESIIFSGVEEVFDIQVDRTENFIANGLVSHNTRWALNDLTGRLTKDMVMNEGADQYEVVEFPAILEKEEENEEGEIQITQKSLWPEQWPLEALLRTKASMPSFQWNAQYQQNPTSEEGAIIKREWWRIWEGERPPQCEFIIQAWDTAFEKSTRADYSACTTWGVWYPEAEPGEPTTGKANIILLDSFKDRMEFPELKKVALEHYNAWHVDSRPVSMMVEKKASGAPLIYELRAMGVPVGEFTPSKGNDKISRVNAVADIFASGMVWAPQTRWAEELMDEVAAFPNGEHDDLVDSMTLALMRFRQGGYVRTQLDEPEPKRYFKRRTQGYY